MAWIGQQFQSVLDLAPRVSAMSKLIDRRVACDLNVSDASIHKLETLLTPVERRDAVHLRYEMARRGVRQGIYRRLLAKYGKYVRLLGGNAAIARASKRWIGILKVLDDRLGATERRRRMRQLSPRQARRLRALQRQCWIGDDMRDIQDRLLRLLSARVT